MSRRRKKKSGEQGADGGAPQEPAQDAAGEQYQGDTEPGEQGADGGGDDSEEDDAEDNAGQDSEDAELDDDEEGDDAADVDESLHAKEHDDAGHEQLHRR